MMRSELTIATIPSSICAAERRDVCAISPNAKMIVNLSQPGAIMTHGRIVIMGMGRAFRLWARPVGESFMDCTRIGKGLRGISIRDNSVFADVVGHEAGGILEPDGRLRTDVGDHIVKTFSALLVEQFLP
jgi:hypothetical protein